MCGRVPRDDAQVAGTDAAGTDVTLAPATCADEPLLANLLELYAHDLSATFALDVRDDGRFGYDKLPLYWREPERRWAFVVRCDGKVAGLALVTRGSPASDDPAALDVAELFVLRRHRRSGVGRRAAVLLWDRFPASTWVVRVSTGNRGALPFWSEVVAAYTGGAFAETEIPGTPHAWRVFTFRSRP